MIIITIIIIKKNSHCWQRVLSFNPPPPHNSQPPQMPAEVAAARNGNRKFPDGCSQNDDENGLPLHQWKSDLVTPLWVGSGGRGGVRDEMKFKLYPINFTGQRKMKRGKMGEYESIQQNATQLTRWISTGEHNSKELISLNTDKRQKMITIRTMVRNIK